MGLHLTINGIFLVLGEKLLVIINRNILCVQWASGIRLDLSEKYILQILWYRVRTRESSKMFLPKRLKNHQLRYFVRFFACNGAKYDPLTLGRG
jgi:hypothetical protein